MISLSRVHHPSEYWLSYSLVSITLRLPLLNSVHQLSSTRVQVNDLSSGGETPRNIIQQFRYRDLLLQMLTVCSSFVCIKENTHAICHTKTYHGHSLQAKSPADRPDVRASIEVSIVDVFPQTFLTDCAAFRPGGRHFQCRTLLLANRNICRRK